MEITIDQALQNAVKAHKAGQIQEADRLYTAILKVNPKHPDANHNMGVLAVSVGKANEALPFLKTALEANPSVAQFWLSFIDTLIKVDRITDAKAVLDQAKNNGATGDRFDKLENLLKFGANKDSILLESLNEALENIINLNAEGRYEEALIAASYLPPEYSRVSTLHNSVGVANQGLGKLEEALKSYKKAISIDPVNVEAHFNMGNILELQAKFEDAIHSFKNALLHEPNYAEAYHNIGKCLQKIGMLEKALLAYRKALSIKPDLVDSHNNMGIIFEEQDKLDEAIDSFNGAISIKPDYLNAWINGAEALEKWNRLEKLELWLESAFAAFETTPPDLKFIKSKLLWRKERFEDASGLLSSIEFDEIFDSRKQSYLQLQAQCYEKCKNYDKAYECYSKSNSWAKKSYQFLNHEPEKYFSNIKNRLTQLKVNPNITSHLTHKIFTDITPTFLVGFPRSGTTLLDTILRSHSRIEVVEEKPLIEAVVRMLEAKGYDNFAEQTIPLDLVKDACSEYEKQISSYASKDMAAKTLIDKMPLNLLQAPLIHQLFPDAKFILALRHPLDTILSCWMQNFKLNPAMSNMVDLDRTVEFYCVAMEMFHICRKNYNLNVFQTRYEDLTNNFQNEAKNILKFLGLEWEAGLENYRETALKRGKIRTPSYSQVVQPIYKDSQYRWLNYGKYLNQYQDQVEPWVFEFGYD